MPITVFYAWQSDRPKNTNERFIQEAAQAAIDRMTADDPSIQLLLDRDTQDVPGIPIIAESIMEKIDRCSLFLCDLTIVSNKGEGTRTPNPNVLLELGYALAKKGGDRIICVMNLYYGGQTQLPFDLGHRRWPIDYRLDPGADDVRKNTVCHQLSQEIENALRTIKGRGLLIPKVNPKDRVVAVRLEHALTHMLVLFDSLFRIPVGEEAQRIWNGNYEDMQGTDYPDPALVDSLVAVLAHNNLKDPSNMRVGDRQLTWAEALILSFTETARECDRILNQYAGQDDNLIALADDIQSRATLLAHMISLPYNVPELTHLYDNGVPENHHTHFRYFFLAMLKAYRIIHQFRDGSGA